MTEGEFELCGVEALPQRESRRGVTKYPFAQLSKRQTLKCYGRTLVAVRSAIRLYQKQHRGAKFIARGGFRDDKGEFVKVWRTA